MKRTVWDGRWLGRHGIARHATEVSTRLGSDVTVLPRARISPTSPLDPAYLRRALERIGCTLFVSPGFNAALPGRYRQLLTIHDLIHLHIKEESSRLKRLYYNQVVRPAVIRSGLVLTVSEFTRYELADWTGLDLDRIVVTGNGTSIREASEAEIDAADALGRDYVLAVTNGKPHKNLPLLFAAMKYLPKGIAVATVGVPEATARQMARAAGVGATRVRCYSDVGDEELRSLYLNARCVAMPSRYEGFGLPAIEAMAVGVATAYVCEAVEEVVGSLGERAPSGDDAEEYARALERAALRGRRDRTALIARSRQYSWDEVAGRVDGGIAELAK